MSDPEPRDLVLDALRDLLDEEDESPHSSDNDRPVGIRETDAEAGERGLDSDDEQPV